MRVWRLFQPHSPVSMLLILSQLLWHKGHVPLGAVSWNWRALLKFSFSFLKSPAMVNHQLTKFTGGTAFGISRLWAQTNDSLTYAFVPLLCSSLDFSDCLSFSCGLLARMPPTIPTIIALLECLLLTEWLPRLVKLPELYEFSLKPLGPRNSWKNVKEGAGVGVGGWSGGEKKKQQLSYGERSKSNIYATENFFTGFNVCVTERSSHHLQYSESSCEFAMRWELGQVALDSPLRICASRDSSLNCMCSSSKKHTR